MSNKKISNKLDNVSIGGDYIGGDKDQKPTLQEEKSTLKNGIILAVIAGVFVLGAALIGLLK